MRKRLTVIALAALISMSTAAAAAEFIEVEGRKYTQEEYPSGYSGIGARDDASEAATWIWDGRDDMVLSGFDGNSIRYRGDLTITLEGENSLAGELRANYHVGLQKPGDNDLTITGDEGASLTMYRAEREHATQVSVSYGDLTIENVTLSGVGRINETDGVSGLLIDNSTIRLEDERAAIWCQDSPGGMTIRNGSTVSLVSGDENPNTAGAGIMSYHTRYNSSDPEDERVGLLAILDSSVSVDGVNVPGGDYAQISVSGRDGAHLIIDNSYVRAVAGGTSAWARGTIVSSVSNPGSSAEENLIGGDIAVTNSEIVSPANAKIVDFIVRDDRSVVKGQTIGYGDETIRAESMEAFFEDERIPATVVIDRLVPKPEPQPVPDPEPVPAPAPEPAPAPAPAAPAAPATALPKTADATLLAEAAVAASGGLLALAGIIRRRRIG